VDWIADWYKEKHIKRGAQGSYPVAKIGYSNSQSGDSVELTATRHKRRSQNKYRLIWRDMISIFHLQIRLANANIIKT